MPKLRSQYSVEEAKKMMLEGTVKIDSSDSLQNYLDLAESALDANNGESALEYADKALEISSKISKAWRIKMIALGLVATFGNLKLQSIIEAGKNAIENSEPDAKEDNECAVYAYFLTHALELMQLAMSKFADTASIKDTYQMFMRISILKAAEETRKADQAYIDLINSVGDQGHALTTYVPDKALGEYDGFAKLLRECGKQYRFVTDAFSKRLDSYNCHLLESAIELREEKAKELEDRAAKAIEKRKERFFKENPGEAAKLRDLQSNLEHTDGLIAAKQDEISKCEAEIKSLGLFKKKEKEPLQNRVKTLREEIISLEAE